MLYVDTDSVVFSDIDKQITKRLPIGQLTNEISSEDGHITTFVSSGPKAYAYRILSDKETCKMRGFTLHWTNSKLINFENIRDIVIHNGIDSITIINTQKISRLS